MDANPEPKAADSYSRLERVALGPFRAGMAYALRPLVGGLARLGVPPNALSLLQIPLGFVVAILIGPAPRAAFGVFLGTLLLDAIDGALARATHRTSTYGALIDQVSDHAREITMVGGLVAAGALRGEIGVAYALTYPAFNFLLYVANRYGASVPLAIKTWMIFYPFFFIFLWSGPNWLDVTGGVAAGLMAAGSAVALVRLRGRMETVAAR